MITNILTIIKMNGEVIRIGHRIPQKYYSHYLDIVKCHGEIFRHVKKNDEYPDEVITIEELRRKEDEFISLMYNIDKHLSGTIVMLSDVKISGIDLRIA